MNTRAEGLQGGQTAVEGEEIGTSIGIVLLPFEKRFLRK